MFYRHVGVLGFLVAVWVYTYELVIMAETKAPSVKTNNETVNEIINQLFTLKKDNAKRDEANSALLSENNQLK